jgi:hypothetical protein
MTWPATSCACFAYCMLPGNGRRRSDNATSTSPLPLSWRLHCSRLQPTRSPHAKRGPPPGFGALMLRALPSAHPCDRHGRRTKKTAAQRVRFSRQGPRPRPPAMAGLLLGGFLGSSVGSSLGGVCSSSVGSGSGRSSCVGGRCCGSGCVGGGSSRSGFCRSGSGRCGSFSGWCGSGGRSLFLLAASGQGCSSDHGSQDQRVLHHSFLESR